MMKKEIHEIFLQKLLCFFVENSMNFSLYFPNIKKFHVNFFFFFKKMIMKLYFVKNFSKKLRNTNIKQSLLINLKVMKGVFFFSVKKKKDGYSDFNKWEKLISEINMNCRLRNVDISNIGLSLIHI